MIIKSGEAEINAVMQAAYELCAAARTAPKACGKDHLETAIVTGEDKDRMAEEMRRLCDYDKSNFMFRDAGNIDKSQAVVLIGVKESPRGLGERCSLCHYKGCDDCAAHNGVCIFDMIDLGIALGSAVSKAADLRIDNRILYSAGKAASSLGYLGEYKTIMAIPLSVSGKTPFFDRK